MSQRSEGSSPCLRCAFEAEQSVEVMTTWSMFARRTTVHGLRTVYVETDEEEEEEADRKKTCFSVRKCVLLSLVFLNTCLLGYQIIFRICTYSEYQSNVNVQFVFTDKLKFPSVTLCNQNSYRITEIVKKKMYNYIEQVVDSGMADAMPGEGVRWKENLTPTEENLTEFLLTAAHQKQDFIDSCTWKGRLCNVENDFKTTFTDFGVCYTFNYKQEHRRFVNQSGARFALRLALNIEQYEYMPGLQSEIGVRVCLHAADEVPLVRDLGVSVSPGTHTLFAVQTEVANDLGPPYGNCVQRARTRAACMGDCEAAQVEHLCGCVDAYMPRVNNADICNVSTAFACAKKQTARLRVRSSTQCTCEAPCYRTQFHGKLSYAHLSKLNVKQLSEYDRLKFKQLQLKFSMARETAERANRAAIQRESDLVSASIGASAAYLGTVQNNHLLLTSDRDLVAQFGASHRATDARGDLRGDLEWLDRDHGNKMAARRFRQPATAKFTNVVNNVKGFLEIREEERNSWWTSAVERRIEDCAAGFESGTDANLSSSLGRYYACDDVTMFTYLWFKKQKILNTISMSAGAATEVEKIRALYEAYASYLYGNTSSDFRNESRFLFCLETLNSSSVLWTNRLAGLTGRMRVYVASETTWKQKREIVGSVKVFYNWTLQNDSLLSDDWFSGCSWPGQCQGQGPDDDDDDDDDDASHEGFESYSQATSESFVELNDLRTALEFTSAQTLGLVEGGLASIARILESFQNGSLSKTELYANLTSLDFEVLFNRMRVASEKYVGDYSDMISNLLFLQNNIRSAYFYAFRLCQPVMNDSSIARLNLTAYARDILRDTNGSSPSSDFGDLLDSLATDRERAFLGLLTVVYRGYRRAMEALQARAQLSFKLLQKALVELTDDLKESFRSSQLNDNFIMENFIKLDIFFEEMGYVKTQQQVSLDELRVISEIGSLLGLLLGASVLSVCEFIDFLIMSAVVRCRAKKGKWSPATGLSVF